MTWRVFLSCMEWTVVVYFTIQNRLYITLIFDIVSCSVYFVALKCSNYAHFVYLWILFVLNDILYAQILTSHLRNMEHIDLSVASIYICICNMVLQRSEFSMGLLINFSPILLSFPIFSSKNFPFNTQRVSLLKQSTFSAQKRLLSSHPQCAQRYRTLLECLQTAGHTGKLFYH